MNVVPTLLLVALVCGVAAAAPPAGVIDDITDGRLVSSMARSTDIPKPLRQNLAKLFHDSKLQLAEPGTPIQADFFIHGVSKPLPAKRFILGFETEKYYCVYIERGPPAMCAYAIVFAKARSRSPQFVWAGSDLDLPFARNIRELRRRLRRGELLDHDPSIW